MLSTVNVPPPKSSTRSLFARARLATSRIARLRPWIESVSASRITGTIRPSSTATATPTLIRRLARRPPVGPVGVERRVLLQGGGHRLDDERDVAEAGALLRLVLAVRLLAERDEAGDVDLHLDVGVRGLERSRHLGRDALAHLGHRDEDLVRAGGERDPGAARRPPKPARAGAGAEPKVSARSREPALLPEPRRIRSRSHRQRARRRPGRRPAAGPLALDVVGDVLAGDPPATAGADDLGGGRGRARGGAGGLPASSGRPRLPGASAGAAATAVGAVRRGGRGALRALVGSGGALGRGRSSGAPAPAGAVDDPPLAASVAAAVADAAGAAPPAAARRRSIRRSTRLRRPSR